MYFNDVSCIAINSLKANEKFGLQEAVHIDWIGIVTISKKKKIIINGEIDYSNIGSSRIINVINSHYEDIYQQEDGKIYFFNEGENFLNIILTNIRSTENYKVFSLICSTQEKYSIKDLSFIKVYTKVKYKNVLLHNEIIQKSNYLQNIFNSTDSAIISIDLEGRITTANNAVLDIFGLNAEKILEKKLIELLQNEELEAITRGVTYVQNNNKRYFAEEVIFNHYLNGKIAVNLIFNPLNDSKNQVVGVVLVASDVTKKKVIQKELEQLKQFSALGELAAGIAHDIRNPLMNIRGCARILEKNFNYQPKQMEFLQPIISEVDRINEVMDQMVSYCDITKQNNYTMLNINEVLNKCYNVILLHKASKCVNIHKDLCHNLPLVKGNNVQLQQAFINILLNSVQAIPNDGEIKIESYCIEEESKILVCISDNGVGISTEEINKIFTPFCSKKINGIGLGLSIVDRVVKRHKGEIIIDSKLNVGTVIKVKLPY